VLLATGLSSCSASTASWRLSSCKVFQVSYSNILDPPKYLDAENKYLEPIWIGVLAG
jgi:hypothetical protein